VGGVIPRRSALISVHPSRRSPRLTIGLKSQRSAPQARAVLTSELLAHLGEVDHRRLFADLGFDSMWAFCTQSLGLCESTAWRRIAAARVCHAYPNALGLVATGELRVVALSLMRTHLNADNAAELFELCRRRSFRQVEELLAARFPKPNVREVLSTGRPHRPARSRRSVDSGESAASLQYAQPLARAPLFRRSPRAAACSPKISAAPNPVEYPKSPNDSLKGPMVRRAPRRGACGAARAQVS